MTAVSSLTSLVEHCCLAAITAQAFVDATYSLSENAGNPQVTASSKGELSFKDGAQDLVTEADYAVQECITTLLAWPRFTRKFLTASGSGKFCVIGEEEQPSVESAHVEALRAQFAPFIDQAFADAQFQRIQQELQTVKATDLSAANVSVLVDPIDATVAFVNGDRAAPMTLIGVAVDGVPLAGIANRLFHTESCTPFPSSLSVCVEAELCIIWGNSVVPQAPPRTDEWRVTFSQSTTALLQRKALELLAPFTPIPLRGGGHKLLHVAAGAAVCDPGAEVFVAVGDLRQWDTCAPHAFLRALGGKLFVLSPERRPSGPWDVTYTESAPEPGESLSVGRGQLLIATSSPCITERVLALLKPLLDD